MRKRVEIRDRYYDKLLHVKTGGHQGFPSGLHYFRYEPTPYSALEKLFESYQITSDNRLVDFGCGKGRLNFFVHYQFHIPVAGVEMNSTFYESARENLLSYSSKTKVHDGQIQFHNCLAEDYGITPSDDRFYFFNPFSVQIFMKVVRNILKSFEKTPRELDLLLYYPSEDYLFFLENETPFERYADVSLGDLTESDPYERFTIYRLHS